MKDERPTSQQIAHQTVSGCGCLFIVIPFAILVFAIVMCMIGPGDQRSTEQIQQDHKKWQQENNRNR